MELFLKDLQFEIYQDQADFDGKINVPLYADDDEAQKVNYALIRFIGGDVDPVDFKLVNIYMMRYSIEIIAFEEYRPYITEMMNHLTIVLDGEYYTLYEGNDFFTTFIETGFFPRNSETVDANGADKFFTGIVSDMLFYENVLHTSNMMMLINGKEFPYKNVKIQRKMVQPEADNVRSDAVSFPS